LPQGLVVDISRASLC